MQDHPFLPWEELERDDAAWGRKCIPEIGGFKEADLTQASRDFGLEIGGEAGAELARNRLVYVPQQIEMGAGGILPP